MLAKTIDCQIPVTKKDAFLYTQQHWSALTHIPGFIGQLGGWDLEDETNSCIIGLWDDEYFYRDFMKNTHDSIFYQSGQQKIYDQLHVSTASNSHFVQGVYRYFRSSAMETNYMIKTTLTVTDYDKQLAHILTKSVQHPGYRCLINVVVPISQTTITIVSLYGTACPPKTIDTLVHPDVRDAKQSIYKIDKKWLVLAQQV
ncbi:YdbC family protein [Metabacillus iocasae]|uniref:DUF4937 domain-containing protein n=1 Tax=Priestia iocasae TaxID=2291674 RepID=A0ABS2QS73_9BACI|nr:YdbC family protein [Metabacillus iocasae]MBM7702260.1 hypothetical protein [Metabacillus iocasae]